jgi:predicted AAA+ superfamily ATPase
MSQTKRVRISFIKHLEFKLTKEATDLLAAIPGPLGVVAVAGLYRTGKSYLLNRMLLNRSDGFGVGPTINPCTKVF